jgi:hypothetical protein
MKVPPGTFAQLRKAIGTHDAHVLGALEHRFSDFVERIPASIPAGDSWAVQSDGSGGADLVVFNGSHVLIVAVRKAEDGSGLPYSIGADLRPLDPTRTTVRFDVGEGDVAHGRNFGRKTVWTFSGDVDKITVYGFVSSDEEPGRPDQAEALARTMAAAVGWPGTLE